MRPYDQNDWVIIEQAMSGKTLTIKQLSIETSLSIGKVVRSILLAQERGLVRVHHVVVNKSYQPREVWQLKLDWIREQASNRSASRAALP